MRRLVAAPLILLLSALPLPARAEEALRQLTITGQATADAPSRWSQISLGLDSAADSAAEAQARLAARLNPLVEQIRRLSGVEKLETTAISLSPRYRTVSGRTQPDGYEARTSLQFQVPVAATGTVLDQLAAAGADRLSGVRFLADPQDLLKARDRALADAARDARRQADAVLASLNLRPDAIVGIDASSQEPGPSPIFYRAAMADAAAPTPVVAGEQTVSARVTLRIRY
jgi:uncharacterized protein YggE